MSEQIKINFSGGQIRWASQAGANFYKNMTTLQSRSSMTWKYETNYRFPALKSLRKHVLLYNPELRSICAEIVRGHGLEAHVGGHHVAVMQDGIRLALIIGIGHRDWN